MKFNDLETLLSVIVVAILTIMLFVAVYQQFSGMKTNRYSLKKGSYQLFPLILVCCAIVTLEAREDYSGIPAAKFITAFVVVAVALFLGKLLPSLIAFYKRKTSKEK